MARRAITPLAFLQQVLVFAQRDDAHLVASCALPVDQVYAMVKAMVANLPDMVAINKAMDGLTPKMMAADIGVPFHPGAVKFYKEVGAM